MRIVYTGGGTMGSVSPLIAIHSRIKFQYNQDYEPLWLGTKNGPEKQIIAKQNISFKAIFSGKLRRYFALKNFIDLLKIKLAFWQSLFILKKFKPAVVLSVGGFVAVPVVWAAWLLKITVIIHQQDIRPGLANKLCAPFAKKITVATDKSLKYFSSKKTIIAGNPVIQKEVNLEAIKKQFNLKSDLPIVLITGGGTGASFVNNLVWQSLDELTENCQLIHLTGKNKKQNNLPQKENYICLEFTDQMIEFIQLADIVVSRAGFATLTELAFYQKPSIIIPISNSHQQDNADYFNSQQAIISLKQQDLDAEKFIKQIKKLVVNQKQQIELSKNINKIFVDYSGQKIVDQIKKYG